MLISHEKSAKPYTKVKITDSYFFNSISQTFAAGKPLTEPLLSSGEKGKQLICNC